MNIPDDPVCACTNNSLLGQVDRVRATGLKIDPLFHDPVSIEEAKKAVGADHIGLSSIRATNCIHIVAISVFSKQSSSTLQDLGIVACL